METELTLEIKNKLLTYFPKSLSNIETNKFRPRFIGFEVPVEHGTVLNGIVDCLRIDEYFANTITAYTCGIKKEDYINPFPYKYVTPKEYIPKSCKINEDNISLYSNNTCQNESKCLFKLKSKKGNQAILFTAFEIKISYSDFKSKHGHNFCGNLNYYKIKAERLLPLGSNMNAFILS
jgi:hypothetical protein